MKKILLVSLILLLMHFAFGQNSSIILHRSSGDISHAYFNDSGLIVQQELTAEMVDTRYLQLSSSLGEIPQPVSTNQRLAFSPLGKFSALITYQGQGDYFDIPEFQVVEVASGNSITIQGAPGLSDVFLSDQGNIIGVKRNINIAEKSEIFFYSPQGELMISLPFPAVTQVHFQENTNILGAISGIRGLVLFTAEGEEIAELGPCNWFDLAGDDGKIFCAFTHGREIGFFDADKPEQVWSKEMGLPAFRDVAVSNAGHVLAVTKYEVYYLNGETGEMIYRRKIDSSKFLTSCDLMQKPDGESFLALGWEIDNGREVHYSQRHTNGGITLLKNPNTAGFSEYTEELDYSNWNVFTPNVKFYHPRDLLLIQTMDEIRYLNLTQGR